MSWRKFKESAYISILKPGITIMQVVTAAYGFLWANGLSVVGVIPFLHLILGTLMLSGGASALNHYSERDIDAKMNRTQNRPIPTMQITAPAVKWIGVGSVVLGGFYLFILVNALTASIGLLTVALYVFVYTPLKQVTSLNTLIGAIPGALPPLGGWAAATGYINVQAFCLFLILFCWQMPHFFALAILYRDDYKLGGLKMLPGEDPTGTRTIRQVIIYSGLLVLAAALPFSLGLAGLFYLIFGMGLTVWFFVICLQLSRDYSDAVARKLFRASIIYLPLILVVILIDFLIRII